MFSQIGMSWVTPAELLGKEIEPLLSRFDGDGKEPAHMHASFVDRRGRRDEGEHARHPHHAETQAERLSFEAGILDRLVGAVDHLFAIGDGLGAVHVLEVGEVVVVLGHLLA